MSTFNRWFKLGLYFALYFFFVWFLAKIANIGTEVATERHPAYDWPDFRTDSLRWKICIFPYFLSHFDIVIAESISIRAAISANFRSSQGGEALKR